MAFAAAALIIAALWVRRQRRAHDWPDDSRAEPDSKHSLQDALSAGTAALRDQADPRAAIIACYAAMEGSLAGAGAVPAASDTPDEVLARAASGGLIRSAAAGELTGLFRQARYGHRDMAEGERTAAQGALTPAARRPGRRGVSDGGQRETPLPDTRAAARAEPPGAPGPGHGRRRPHRRRRRSDHERRRPHHGNWLGGRCRMARRGRPRPNCWTAPSR